MYEATQVTTMPQVTIRLVPDTMRGKTHRPNRCLNPGNTDGSHGLVIAKFVLVYRDVLFECQPEACSSDRIRFVNYPTCFMQIL
jgi:hypothetical protein